MFLFFVLLLAFVLRTVNLNQSLWLDEAVQAVTAKGPFLGIFEELRGDFHPPLYHILLWGWTRIFGASEVSLRMPSVIFGTATIWVLYLITKQIVPKKFSIFNFQFSIPEIAALFLATAPFHIYYSQEARMYSMTTFFATLSMYFFIKIINGLTNYELRIKKLKKFRINELTNYGFFWGYFVSTACLIYSDYYGFLVLLAQIIGGVIIFRKNLNIYISKFLHLYIPIFLFYLPWLPFLISQFKTGVLATTALPEWKNLVNASFIKAIPLTFVKFAAGRITIFDKKIYALIVGVLGLVYGWLILKGVIMGKKLFNCSTAQLLIGLWLVVPVFIAWLVSFFVPNYQPFRLLLVLPAFYLLLAIGISSLQSNKLAVFLSSFVILVNLTSLLVYYRNPYFWREDWRGVANYLKSQQIPLVISSDTFAWPLIYYQQEKNLIAVGKGVRKVSEEDKINLTANLRQIKGKRLAYTPYLADLYDPDKKIPSWLKEMGFDKIGKISFNQVPLWIYENRH